MNLEPKTLNILIYSYGTSHLECVPEKTNRKRAYFEGNQLRDLIPMPLNIRKALLVYCSPAGSAAHVARIMRKKIFALETPVTMIDLADDPDVDFIISQLFDAEDDRMIEALLETVAGKLKKTDPPTLAPSVLDYQEKSIRDQMAQMSFEKAKSRFPKRKVLKERCTQCGVCVENCPVEAIHLTDVPEIGPVCIHCLNCVRLCPESAIVADLQPVYEHLHERAEKIKERPCTQFFI